MTVPGQALGGVEHLHALHAAQLDSTHLKHAHTTFIIGVVDTGVVIN